MIDAVHAVGPRLDTVLTSTYSSVGPRLDTVLTSTYSSVGPRLDNVLTSTYSSVGPRLDTVLMKTVRMVRFDKGQVGRRLGRVCHCICIERGG